MHQMRGGKIWSQVEATFKQMDTAGTEYECFQALKRQEQVASVNRINSIWEDVQKQKELEKSLQKRYGDLIVEQERIYHLMENYRKEEAAKQEITETKMAEAEEVLVEMTKPPLNNDDESANEPMDVSEPPTPTATVEVDVVAPPEDTEKQASAVDVEVEKNETNEPENAMVDEIIES